MIKLSLINVLIGSLMLCTVRTVASETTKPAVEICFNAFVSLETDDWNNAITDQISAAIAQKVPVICCTTLLTQMRKSGDPRIIILQFQSSFTVFTTDVGDISVLVPSGHIDNADAQKLLATFGLTNLKYIPPQDVIATIESASSKQTKLIAQFDQLFIKNQTDNPVPKKHFYVMGHGRTNSSIAGIPMMPLTTGEQSPFARFLRTIENINTELLYINSCYAGGPNIITLQNELIRQATELFKTPSISFMVIVQATTDEVTFATSETVKKKVGKFIITYDYYKNFFTNVDRYFIEKLRKDLPFKESITLTNVLMPLYETYPSVLKLPSVRLPGSNSFFRPIIIDKIKVVTFLDVQQLLTQEIFQKRFGEPGQTISKKDIFVGAGIKYVLVYPAVIPANVSLASQLYDLVFVSKIPGTAGHIIDSLTFERPISYSSINNELGNLFLRPMISYQKEIEGQEEGIKETVEIYKYGESLKAWFIKTVIYYKDEKQNNLEDVIIVKYASPTLKTTPGYYGELIYKRNGQYYICYGQKILSEQAIDETEYWKRAADILKSSLPDEAALYEATGGGQDRSTINDAVTRLFPTIEIVSSLALSAELSQMRDEIGSYKSKDFGASGAFVKYKLIPFIESNHSEFKKEHVSELIALLKKIIDDGLAKKVQPTFKLTMFVIDPVSTAFAKHIPGLVSTTIHYELGNLRQYIYAKLIEKTAAELVTTDHKIMTIVYKLEQLIIDDELNVENKTRISTIMQKEVDDIIKRYRLDKQPKNYAQDLISLFFEKINEAIDGLNHKQTKEALKEIVAKIQAHADAVLITYEPG